MTAYPLASLLALRGREEAAARLDVARALAAEDVARAARAAAHASVEERRARLARAARGPGSGEGAGAFAARASFTRRLRGELAALEIEARRAGEAVARARVETDGRREDLANAHRAVRTLERHLRSWRAETFRERDRREEAAADDVVSARRAAP